MKKNDQCGFFKFFTGYTESESRIGIWQGGARHLNQAEPVPKQPNLNKLGDAGRFKCRGCPTLPEPMLDSRAVYTESESRIEIWQGGSRHLARRLFKHFLYNLSKRRILFGISYFGLAHAFFHPEPHAIIPNARSTYSLLNSVDFHPKEPIFCVTHTHNNIIRLYRIDNDMHPVLIQTIKGVSAQLKEPQHAVFSPDGKKIVVANWTDRSLNVYLRKNNGLFEKKPIHTVFLPEALHQSKPHGIAFSPSGQYLAVACGASHEFKNGLALFENIGYRLKHVDILTHDQLPGIPKGICFSPDGTCLLVTFCEPSGLAIFHFDGKKINPLPKQIIQGDHTGLSRPEDIKLMPKRPYCSVSNSDKNTVTFYHFDKSTNTIADTPCWSLKNPEAHLTFPHGIAFSAEGSYLAVTQFGHIEVTQEGNIVWKSKFPPQEGAVNIYREKEIATSLDLLHN